MNEYYIKQYASYRFDNSTIETGDGREEEEMGGDHHNNLHDLQQ